LHESWTAQYAKPRLFWRSNQRPPNIGAAGVVYVSTPIVFDPDSDKSIGPIVNGTINTLEAAARAGIKRYVLCSSSKAVESTVYNQPHELTRGTFNNESIHMAYNDPPADASERALVKYCAGRTAAELAFWRWVKTNRPPFVANCVVPDGVFGRVLDVEHVNMGATSSVGMLKRVLAGNSEDIMLHLG
jgi:nucleoside-diphosphate-sugar epimerase